MISTDLSSSLPSNISIKNIRFVRYNDFILFDEKSFLLKFQFDSREQFLNALKNKNTNRLVFFESLRKKLNFQRAGFINNICDDEFRTPNVLLFYSENLNPLDSLIDPWVIHTDNGIKYTFDVTRTMFCKGNIKEKLRLAKINCQDQIVVDLFAGIGYFSLIFAVHCKAKHVYCCEWNPAALEALHRNIKLNHVEDRMTILPGDNRKVCPNSIAQRVQMGLIPTSLDSLKTACNALNFNDRINEELALTLHIHENLDYFHKIKAEKNTKIDKKQLILQEQKFWSENIRNKVHLMLKNTIPYEKLDVKIGNVSKIKQYAPYIDHMVCDIEISRQES